MTAVPWRLVAATLLLVVAGSWASLVTGLTFWANAPMIGGWRPRVVLTGSMQPAVKPGDIVLVQSVDRPAELPPGRVVVVRDPSREGGTYVHRIARVEGGQLVTKGDANQSEDAPAVAPQRVVGQVRLVVPIMGLPAVWARHGELLRAGLSVLGTWLALAVVVQGYRNLRTPATAKTVPDDVPAGTVPR